MHSQGIGSLRKDVRRSLNPTPYKVSLTTNLFNFLQQLWEREAPIASLS